VYKAVAAADAAEILDSLEGLRSPACAVRPTFPFPTPEKRLCWRTLVSSIRSVSRLHRAEGYHALIQAVTR